MSFRATYEARAEADFAGIQTQLSALAANGRGTFDDGAGWLRELQSKQSEVLQRLQVLKAVDSGAWGAVMIAFENAWSELRLALHR